MDGTTVDVLVVSALAREQKAALAAFGIDPNRKEDRNIDGHKVFFGTFEDHEGKKRSLALAAVNNPRNVNMGLVTQDLISRFNPGDAFLCGITAAHPKTDFCDVCVSTRVWDIAGGRDEVSGRKPRDEPFTPPLRMRNYLDYFEPKAELWRNYVLPAIEDARKYADLTLVSAEKAQSLQLRIFSGIFFADETLMADGDWEKLVDRDQRALAREMESSGFAQACQARSVDWLVFKACSDHGDASKADNYQQTAAFVAASAVRLFLRTEYRMQTGDGESF